MSEFINNSEQRLKDLLAFSSGIMSGEDGKLLIEKYKDAIDHITPTDMIKLEDRQIQMGLTPKRIKGDIGKIINVFFASLDKYEWKKPVEGTFLYYLMLENSAYRLKLNSIKNIIRDYSVSKNGDFTNLKQELLPLFQEFKSFESHYVKKENILFPYLEKIWDSYRPLKVMWSIHDDIRRALTELINILQSDSSAWDEFNKKVGSFFFMVFGMIQKEEMIIYPVATETVKESDWIEMHTQSFEYPFPFIEAPVMKKAKSVIPTEKNFSDGENQFVTETGALTMEQVELMVNNLPLDITFVDEDDKVRFFSRPKERFFPRSPAIVGRKVQNCHPPESVHIVEKIIKSFKSGEKDKAQFWLTMKEKFILIQYFALRSEDGEYKGILEVSQDATQIRSLKGDKRLLEWD